MSERRTSLELIDLKTKLKSFDDQWSPKIIAALNGQEVKLVKIEGAFEWHSHQEEDELFLVLEGGFTMQFREYEIDLTEGQVIVVPRKVEHRPVAEKPCSVLLFEPSGVINTGDSKATDRTTTGTWI